MCAITVGSMKRLQVALSYCCNAVPVVIHVYGALAMAQNMGATDVNTVITAERTRTWLNDFGMLRGV